MAAVAQKIVVTAEAPTRSSLKDSSPVQVRLSGPNRSNIIKIKVTKWCVMLMLARNIQAIKRAAT